MANEPKETAFQKRMKSFREAQDMLAAAREKAKRKSLPADDDD